MHSSIVCIHVYPPRKVCTVTLLMVWDIHNIITIPINILDYKKSGTLQSIPMQTVGQLP